MFILKQFIFFEYIPKKIIFKSVSYSQSNLKHILKSLAIFEKYLKYHSNESFLLCVPRARPTIHLNCALNESG